MAIKNSIYKSQNQNMIDFILTYKGSIEDYLFEFMLEQGYTDYNDFDNSTDKYIRTYKESNIVTDFYTTENIIVTTKVIRPYEFVEASYDYSFDLSFES